MRLKLPSPARAGARSIALTVIAMMLLSGCSKLGLFDAVVPHDRGAETAATDVPYGPHPRQQLDVYRPQEPSDPRPVVLFIYGGSWSNGSKDHYGFAGKAFAAAGFVTVVADYRLVPDVRYPAFLADNASALAWVQRRIAGYGGDPERIFLAGHSAGAYNAVMLALAPSFLAAEGLDPAVIKGVAGISGPYDFYPFDTEATRAAFAGIENPPSSQPVNRVGATAPPMLLVTGESDRTVRPANTAALARQLAAHGVAHQTRYYPGLDHAGALLAISRPLRRTAPVLEDVVAFFRSL